MSRNQIRLRVTTLVPLLFPLRARSFVSILHWYLANALAPANLRVEQPSKAATRPVLSHGFPTYDAQVRERFNDLLAQEMRLAAIEEYTLQ